MKSHILSICCFFITLAQLTAQSSQETRLVFQPITLTGQQAKTLFPATFRPQWQVGLAGGVSLNNPVQAQVLDGGGLSNIQQEIFSDPVLSGQLLEALGGDFFIGNPFGNKELVGISKNQSPSFGLAVSLRLKPRWQLEGGISASRSEVEGAFPVTVFSHQTGQPHTLQGGLYTKLTHQQVYLGSAWFLGHSTFQPFLCAGLQVSKMAAATTVANIAGVQFPVEEQPTVYAASPYGTAGVEVHPSIPLFFRATFTVGTGKIHSASKEGSETVLQTSIQAGIGWRF
jgi:hypothetical protein